MSNSIKDTQCCNDFNDCIEKDHFECLKDIINKNLCPKNKIKKSKEIFLEMVEYGRLDMIKYIYENKYYQYLDNNSFNTEIITHSFASYFTDIVNRAGYYNRLDILKYLLEEKRVLIWKEFGPHTESISKGNFECYKCIVKDTKYFGKHDYNSIFLACNYNRLDILDYAYKNGCEIESILFMSVCLNQNFDCLDYCLKHEIYKKVPLFGSASTYEEFEKKYIIFNMNNLNLNLLIKHSHIRKFLLKYEQYIQKEYNQLNCILNEYKEYENKIIKILYIKTTLPFDIIKYELKYI
jgi:hypothetical protein